MDSVRGTQEDIAGYIAPWCNADFTEAVDKVEQEILTSKSPFILQTHGLWVTW